MHFAPLRIRKLGPVDEPTLVGYLENDASNNIFLLADLVQYGWEHPQLRYYGALRGARMVGVLMLFGSSAGTYWHDPAVLKPFADIIADERISTVSGRRRIIKPWMPYLPAALKARLLDGALAVLRPGALCPWPERGERLAGPDDIDVLVDLYAENLITTARARQAHRARLQQLFDFGGSIALIEQDGMAVSAARTAAVGHSMAVIGGVVTLPRYRRRGFARACTGLLSQHLLEAGCVPHLIYDRTDAAPAHLYAGLGYEPIEEWFILFRES